MERTRTGLVGERKVFTQSAAHRAPRMRDGSNTHAGCAAWSGDDSHRRHGVGRAAPPSFSAASRPSRRWRPSPTLQSRRHPRPAQSASSARRRSKKVRHPHAPAHPHGVVHHNRHAPCPLDLFIFARRFMSCLISGAGAWRVSFPGRHAGISVVKWLHPVCCTPRAAQMTISTSTTAPD